MCLGIPMEVVEVDGFVARCVAQGVERKVNLMLIGEGAVAPGGHVLVHLGNAVETLTPAEYEEAWDVLRKMNGI